MSQLMKMVYENYSKNRKTVEKWLSYPRQLQQEYGVNPVIAGGAIRDTLLGGGVKDIDVFVTVSKNRVSDNQFESLIEKIANDEGWEFCRWGNPGDSHDIYAIYQVYIDEMLYNIMVLTDDLSSREVVSSFNFGINQVAVNTYGILAIGTPFIHDATSQCITITNTQDEDQLQQSYDKLSAKYPWPLHSRGGVELSPAPKRIIIS